MGTHWSLLQVCSNELNKYVKKLFTNYQCHIFVLMFKLIETRYTINVKRVFCQENHKKSRKAYKCDERLNFNNC